MTKGLFERNNKFERVMDDIETLEVWQCLNDHRKEIIHFYESISKKEILDG